MQQLQQHTKEEFRILKSLLLTQDTHSLSISHLPKKTDNRMQGTKQRLIETSYNLVIGNLLWRTSANFEDATSLKLSPAVWTCMTQGFEILYKKAFGRPQYLFRTFNIINREHRAWKACALGNLQELQILFGCGQASPYDMTEDGANLLHVGY